ncbi:MAG: 2-oxo acid dehydrogenase subunit E2 [Actinobacteria bacterium]|nr:2-oxo acid dehydrogenase subunit E2 [Actinomycetota bacterium]
MPDVPMPRLSDSMEEGTVLRWLKQVGEEVALGEPLVEIETDKANMVYEADVAGTLTQIVVADDEGAPVGSPIAVIGEPSQAPAATTAPAATAEVASPATEVQSAPRDSGRIRASPVARRLAKDQGIDLASIAGSARGGRIVKRDVKQAAEGAGGTPGADSGSAGTETAKGAAEVQELTKLQQVVARRMAESKATAPHFYLEAEVDMSRAVEARAAIKSAANDGDVVPSFNDMVVKACALALKEFPRANGAYKDGRFELYSRVNVGIAVAAQDALVVPTLFDADTKGLRQIAVEARALATKVREGTITPPELSGGTFTVSNLGMFGIDSFSAIVNSPQAGILAVGRIAERPAVRNGQMVPAQLMNVTLSCDHRILYGADGAKFLARVRQLLEEPVGLAL